MDISWVKLSTDIFSNRKIKKIRKMEDGESIFALWMYLLCRAGACNDGGRVYFTENIPYDAETLADELSIDEETVQRGLDAFRRFNMIEMDEDGMIWISSWEEYQNVDKMEKIRENDRIRKRRERAAKKAATEGEHGQSTDMSENVHGMSMDASKDVQKMSGKSPDTEVEEDREEEVEEETTQRYINNNNITTAAKEESTVDAEDLGRKPQNGKSGGGKRQKKDQARGAAEYLAGIRAQNFPRLKPPDKKEMDEWTAIFNTINREDGASWTEIKAAIDFATQDDFWKSRILRPAALKKHYAKIRIQMERGGGKDEEQEERPESMEYPPRSGNIIPYERYLAYRKREDAFGNTVYLMKTVPTPEDLGWYHSETIIEALIPIYREAMKEGSKRGKRKSGSA